MVGLEARVVAELKSSVAPGYVHDAPSEIIAYSYDGTFQQRRPDLVVSPASTDEVAAIVRVAAPNTPIPFAPVLEDFVIPDVDAIVAGIRATLA